MCHVPESMDMTHVPAFRDMKAGTWYISQYIKIMSMYCYHLKNLLAVKLKLKHRYYLLQWLVQRFRLVDYKDSPLNLWANPASHLFLKTGVGSLCRVSGTIFCLCSPIHIIAYTGSYGERPFGKPFVFCNLQHFSLMTNSLIYDIYYPPVLTINDI